LIDPSQNNSGTFESPPLRSIGTYWFFMFEMNHFDWLIKKRVGKKDDMFPFDPPI
jgi:hypothetical protein